MIKRYDAYFGSNVSMSQIARENPGGEWVKFDDIKKFFGLHSPEELEDAIERASK